MKNIKLARFVNSFVLLPITAMSGVPMGPSVGYIAQSTLNMVASPESAFEITLPGINEDQGAIVSEERAKAIDQYFSSQNLPMAGTGKKMVEEALKNDLDWRIIPAIAMRESTGGKFACKRVANNPFGWGSCKISFTSYEHAIEVLAKNLGGNNPKTAHHYDEKTTKEILRAYNPPSIVPKYAEQVMSIMSKIGAEDLGEVATNI